MHLTLDFSIGKEFKFNEVVGSMYNRMSNFPTLNWAGINKDRAVLPSIDAKNNQVILGFYNHTSPTPIIPPHISIYLPFAEEQKTKRFVAMTEQRIFVFSNGLSCYKYL